MGTEPLVDVGSSILLLQEAQLSQVGFALLLMPCQAVRQHGESTAFGLRVVNQFMKENALGREVLQGIQPVVEVNGVAGRQKP